MKGREREREMPPTGTRLKSKLVARTHSDLADAWRAAITAAGTAASQDLQMC